MQGNITPVRPALAAIAAVLAFGSTPLMAQTADPQLAPPPAAAAPVVAAPVPVTPPSPMATPPAAPVMAAPMQQTAPAETPVFKPQTPVVQAVPPRPVVAPEPQVAPEATPAPVERSNRAARAEAAPAPKAAPVTETPVETAPSPLAADPAPSAAPDLAAAPATPVNAAPADTPQAAAPAPISMDNEGTLAIAGGLAALLAVAGLGGAVAFRRRRKHAGHSEAIAVVTPVAAHDYTPATTNRGVVSGAYAPVIARDMPAPVSAPAHDGSLEDMIAQAPSRENPFLTRRNRLRRAEFLIRQREAIAPAPVQTPAAAVAAREERPVAQQPVRPTVTYDFGWTGSVRRRFTPATT